MQEHIWLLNPFQPEALLWQVKSSGVRQSKITKCLVLAGLGGKGLLCEMLFIRDIKPNLKQSDSIRAKRFTDIYNVLFPMESDCILHIYLHGPLSFILFWLDNDVS